MSKNFKQLLNQVNAFVFNMDGVLTNGSLILTSDGEPLRSMNSKDIYALQQALVKGYKVAIIVEGKSEAAIGQLKQIGLTDIFIRIEDKKEALKKFMDNHSLRGSTILYMGDDIPDLQIMKTIGVPTSPKDGVSEIKASSIYISEKKGGEGCVRDVIEQVLKAQGKWMV